MDYLPTWGIAWKSLYTGLTGQGTRPIFAKWSEAKACCEKLDLDYPGIAHWPHSNFSLTAYTV